VVLTFGTGASDTLVTETPATPPVGTDVASTAAETRGNSARATTGVTDFRVSTIESPPS
jgi:hypothetical protein